MLVNAMFTVLCLDLFCRDKMLYQQLLVELYSQCPKVISWLSDVQGSFFDGQLSQSTITQVNVYLKKNTKSKK